MRKKTKDQVVKKATLKVVFDDDIETLLSSLGELESFKSGNATCAICGDVISKTNLQAVFPRNDDVCFCCSKPHCYMQILMIGD